MDAPNLYKGITLDGSKTHDDRSHLSVFILFDKNLKERKELFEAYNEQRSIELAALFGSHTTSYPPLRYMDFMVNVKIPGTNDEREAIAIIVNNELFEEDGKKKSDTGSDTESGEHGRQNKNKKNKKIVPEIITAEMLAMKAFTSYAKNDYNRFIGEMEDIIQPRREFVLMWK